MRSSIILPSLLFIASAVLAQDSSSYTDSKKFQQAILDTSNKYREAHNATDFKWNDTIADFADDYVSDCKFEHSGGPYGENLAAGYGNASAAVMAWGDEGEKYNFKKGKFGEDTGHFTQLVWKGSTTVGCGRKKCDGDNGTPGWYVVCEYYPRGNVLGSFVQNVQASSPALRTMPMEGLQKAVAIGLLAAIFVGVSDALSY